MEVLARTVREEKEIKCIQIGKEEGANYKLTLACQLQICSRKEYLPGLNSNNWILSSASAESEPYVAAAADLHYPLREFRVV